MIKLMKFYQAMSTRLIMELEKFVDGDEKRREFVKKCKELMREIQD